MDSTDDSLQIGLLAQLGHESVGSSASDIDMKLARYFASFLLTETIINLDEDNRPVPTDPTERSVHVLAEVANDVSKLNRDPQSLHKGRTTAASFILSILRELREIICGKGKTPKKLSEETKSILAALTVVFAHKFGLSDGTSTAFAALTLITVARATKNAFCKMDDIEIYKAVKEAEEGDR
jgi:hypothetical protein